MNSLVYLLLLLWFGFYTRRFPLSGTFYFYCDSKLFEHSCVAHPLPSSPSRYSFVGGDSILFIGRTGEAQIQGRRVRIRRRRHVPVFGEWSYYSSSSSPEEPQLPHSEATAAGDSA